MTNTKKEDVDALIEVRKKAEAVVEGMPDGALKVAAFEKAFDRLVGNDEQPAAPARTRRTRKTAGTQQSGAKRRKREGPKAHVRDVMDEGFFAESRTVPEVVAELLARGHKYPIEAASTALTRLTRDRDLKRKKEPRGEGSKQVWVYEKE